MVHPLLLYFRSTLFRISWMQTQPTGLTQSPTRATTRQNQLNENPAFFKSQPFILKQKTNTPIKHK